MGQIPCQHIMAYNANRSYTQDSSACTPGVKLPGLNTIRFYAALSVIFEHISIHFSQPTVLLKNVSFLFMGAQHAVNLFFVLSGFLITHLLLCERKLTKTISIPNFYIRRALRILPLYYWVAILGLVIFPILFGATYPLTGIPVQKILLALALLPNFASITTPMIHLWSIGVEEQFYVTWPWVTRDDGNLLRVIFGIIVIKLFLTPVLAYFDEPKILNLFYGLRFECMAIGALGAYIYDRKYEYTRWIYNRWTQIVVLSAFLCLLVVDLPINTYTTICTAVVYLILIMNVATNTRSLINLNIPILEKMGEISYGLYLYHFPILYLVFFLAAKFRLDILWTSPHLLTITVLVSTWVVAALSYRWFEMPFLRLKGRFLVKGSPQNQDKAMSSPEKYHPTSGILEKSTVKVPSNSKSR